MQKIGKDSVVALEYSLHLGDGQIVDHSEPGDPLVYLHGAGNIVPGLESALEGMGVGDTKKVVVAPAEGYGEHDPRGQQEVPREAFPPDFQPQEGMGIVAEGPNGETVNLWVKAVKPASIVIDQNHPLAGKTLHFSVEVKEVRAATAEELEHGHVHGPEGHGHDHGDHEGHEGHEGHEH